MRLPTFYEQNLIPNWGKILSHSSLRHICGRVVDFFRKLKFIVAYLLLRFGKQHPPISQTTNWGILCSSVVSLYYLPSHASGLSFAVSLRNWNCRILS